MLVYVCRIQNYARTTTVGNGGSLTLSLSLSLNSRPQIQRFPVSLLFLLHNYLAVKLTELLHIAIDMWFTYVLNMREKKHIAMLVSMQKVSMLICPLLLLSLKSPILWASKPPTPRATLARMVFVRKSCCRRRFWLGTGSPLNRLVAGSSIFFLATQMGIQ